MLCQWHQTMNSGELQGDPSDSYGVVFDEVLFEWAGVVHCLVSRCVQRWQFVFLTESNLSPSIVCQWFMSKYIQSSQMTVYLNIGIKLCLKCLWFNTKFHFIWRVLPALNTYFYKEHAIHSHMHTSLSAVDQISTNWILVQISVLWALRSLDPQSFILMIYQCPISF